MESIWTGPWNPYGMVYSMDNPYGFHSGYGLKKWLGTQPKNSPYGIHGLGVGIHPVHMESIWNHLGSVKTSDHSFFLVHFTTHSIPPQGPLAVTGECS